MPFATILPIPQRAQRDTAPPPRPEPQRDAMPSTRHDAQPGPAPADSPVAPVARDEQVTAWVSRVFVAIQAAWSSGDARRLAPYVSASLGARLVPELDAFRRDGVVNRVDDPRLQEVTLLSDRSDESVVEVLFTARDWVADLRSGAVVDGDPRRVRSFRQRWHVVPAASGEWLLDRVDPT